MGSYIPSTKEERQEMLAAAGYGSIRSLFKDVPAEVYLDKPLNLPQGMSELEVRAKMQELAGKNTVFGTILRGAGAYDQRFCRCRSRCHVPRPQTQRGACKCCR